MKKNLHHTVLITSVTLILSFFLFTSSVVGQDLDRIESNEPRNPDQNNLDDPGRDPDNPLPLDGGLSLLLAAGAAYGGKKLADQRKNRKNK
jgi:hypothetical protein